MIKSSKVMLLAVLALGAKLVFAAAPVFVEYSMSMSDKKSTVSQVVEDAKSSNASAVYIYYHDSKSQDMASKIKDKIQGKLPASTKVVLLDQTTGTPKYTGSKTPDGVAIVTQ